MQHSLREDAPEVRERTPAAVHASRPGPITWPIVGRVLLIASGVAVFISLFGPFHGRSLQTIAVRETLYFGFAWSGSLLGMSCVRLAAKLGLWPRGVLPMGLTAGVLMAFPMTPIVWVGTSWAQGRWLPVAALPEVAWQVFLISVGSSLLAVVSSRNAANAAAAARAAMTAPGPPKFLERLPLKLRGAEVWAVEAEDHYLRLHTSKGQDLILMRLSDAIAELDGIEGAQVHRSWWVARDAIADAVRGDGRATLTLKDGSEVPVSRTYARVLRDRRWI